MTIDKSLSIEEVRCLPCHERIKYIQRIRLTYPLWHDLLGEMQTMYDAQPYAAEPPCLLLVAGTGAGKSTLAQAFLEQHPPRWTKTKKIVPVLRISISPPATVGGLAEYLLAALGDPFPKGRKISSMTIRLMMLLKECGVRMLIVDEIQHFVDRDSEILLRTVTDWLKNLIKEAKVSCVLIGMKDDAEVILVNKQLKRLFHKPRVLSPFAWDEARPQETILPFRALLQKFESLLPLNESSDLSDHDTAYRLFVACRGVMGPLVTIIRGATEQALIQGQEYINIDLLAAAYDRFIDEDENGPNPFRGSLPVMDWKQLASSVPTTQNPSSRDATNRRSKARERQQESIKDIL